MVANGKETRVYANPDEMPARLRRRMERALGSELSATIIIAGGTGAHPREDEELPPGFSWRSSGGVWLELAAAGAAVLLLLAIAVSR